MKSKLMLFYRWDLLFAKFKRKVEAQKKIKSDREYWQSLKNIHEGKIGFIIGNGPSLKVDDLSKIQKKGYLSIASNNIFHAFEDTKWRPDYYTIADPLVWDRLKKDIDERIKVVHTPAYLDFKDCNIEVKSWKTLSNNFKKDLSNISDNISIGAAGGYTVTYENIQLALHLGFNPIYIIGCDHYYAGEEDLKQGQKYLHVGKVQNHFIKDYIKPNQKTTAAPIKKMTRSYQIARLYSDEKNIEVLNATRGGHLEVFKRVDLDDILK